mgnify:CR=1 FL=1
MEKSKRLSENRLAHSEKNVGVLQIRLKFEVPYIFLPYR